MAYYSIHAVLCSINAAICKACQLAPAWLWMLARGGGVVGAALQVRQRQAHHTITMVALHHRHLPTTITTMSLAGVKAEVYAC